MPLTKAIGQAIFKALAPDGASAASMIRAAQKLGGAYRRQEMLSDIRKYTGRVKNQVNIERMTGNSVIPKAWMVETDLNEPGANYRVFGKAQVVDYRSGLTTQQTFSFYHTDMMNNDNFAREFNETFAENSIEPDFEFVSFQVSFIEHNQGKPY